LGEVDPSAELCDALVIGDDPAGRTVAALSAGEGTDGEPADFAICERWPLIGDETLYQTWQQSDLGPVTIRDRPASISD
jgi:hypothetical protein